MMLHQAFPHLHHQHEETHAHSDIAHTGEHYHSDDHSQEDENSPLGFFEFFLDIHVHSTVSSDIGLFNRDSVEKQTIIGKKFAIGVFYIEGLFLIENGQIEHLLFIIHLILILIIISHPSKHEVPHLSVNRLGILA